MHNNPVNGIDPSGNFSIPSVSMSVAVGSLLLGFGVLATRVGEVVRERIMGYRNCLDIYSQEKENANATIIIHGLAPHGYGWSSDFINNLGFSSNKVG